MVMSDRLWVGLAYCRCKIHECVNPALHYPSGIFEHDAAMMAALMAAMWMPCGCHVDAMWMPSWCHTVPPYASGMHLDVDGALPLPVPLTLTLTLTLALWHAPGCWRRWRSYHAGPCDPHSPYNGVNGGPWSYHAGPCDPHSPYNGVNGGPWSYHAGPCDPHSP